MNIDTQEMPTPGTGRGEGGAGVGEVVDDAVGRTHRGHARASNQDRMYVGEVVFAVADGMGGRPGGEVAADTALEPITQMDHEPAGADVEVVLRDAVLAANTHVHARAQAEPEHQGMGTTVTAMALDGDRALLAHVGDSRAYLCHDGDLRQLTTDHTLVQRLVDAGAVSACVAGRHPDRHVITRAVGLQEHVDVDVTVTDLDIGDTLLLCTDGLTGVVDDARIAAILAACPDASEAANQLIGEALDAGGPDNVTAVVVHIDGRDGD